MDVNQDFAECIESLNRHGVEFLLVGAHAMSQFGLVRYTGNMDLWLRPTLENLDRARGAIIDFGFPLPPDPSESWLTPGEMIQMGVPPVRIDLLTEISGVSFDDAWERRIYIEFMGVPVNMLSREDLIRNKRASARPKDLLDADALEQ